MQIKGKLKKIIFNGNNGYIVGLFKVMESSEALSNTITFTGYFHELNDNDTYILNGDFTIHNKYGEQFLVESYDRVLPEEKDSIVEFLSGGLFKGIGKKTAEKIVKVLGSDTLEIILNNPDNLLLISGITKKQVDTLHTTLLDYESSYNTIIKLSELGFNTKDSMSIYNKFRQNTDNIINTNIYEVYYKIKDITFKNVDRIALNNNYTKDDKRRISAAIYNVFEECTNTLGASYFNIDPIFNYTKRLLNIDIRDEDFIECLNTLILDLKIVKEEEKYYLKTIRDAEENISKRFAYLTRLGDFKIKNLDKLINTLETLNKIVYDEKQREAIKLSMIKNILVITGGPGSGKTTIIKTIVDLYRDINKLTYDKMINEIALLAPTGRASKRLSESCVFPSTTIHRFLKWNKDLDKFAINEYNKSEVKFVIIDEVSMVDTYLLDNLLKGLKTDTKIILVGDYNQLPSVGPGQILKDVIDSDTISTVYLNKLHRQEEGSNIIDLAYDINNGKVDKELFNKNSDLEFIKSSSISKDILSVVSSYTNNDYKDFQILAPMYKTIDGIDNLNKILQNAFNPKAKNKKEMIVDEVIYRENDKILQLTNMPDENIFNGDIGVISKIEDKNIFIDFDGNLVKFTPSTFKNFKHGYVISIHKSQGSEFDTVILPVSLTYSKMLYRKLYYTAVTRSKKKLIILGELRGLEYASTNNVSSGRMTSLKENLIKKIKINE